MLRQAIIDRLHLPLAGFPLDCSPGVKPRRVRPGKTLQKFTPVYRQYGVGPSIIGPTTLVGFYTMFFAAFPDWHTTIDDMVAEGDKVVVRITSNRTHKGEMQGTPATGKPDTQNAIVIYRLTNGKIVEGRLQTDI